MTTAPGPAESGPGVVGQLQACLHLAPLHPPDSSLAGSFGAVVEVVPGGTPFHLDGSWSCIGDFVCSFSSGLVPLSPEHP